MAVFALLLLPGLSSPATARNGALPVVSLSLEIPGVSMTMEDGVLNWRITEDGNAHASIIAATLSHPSDQDVTVAPVISIEGDPDRLGECGSWDNNFPGNRSVCTRLVPRPRIVIAAGETRGLMGLYVIIKHDRLDEPDEVLTLGFGTVTGATPGKGHKITIVDNDDPPIVRLSLSTDPDDSQVIAVKVSLTVASGMEVRVPFTIGPMEMLVGNGAEGTVESAEYNEESNTVVVIEAGERSGVQTFTLEPRNGPGRDNGMMVTVVLGEVVNAVKAYDYWNRAEIFVSNSVPTIDLAVSPTSITENGGERAITVTATLTEASNWAMTIPFTAELASSGSGHGIAGSTVIEIGKGDLSGEAVFILTPFDDTVEKNNESVVVELSGSNIRVGDTTGSGFRIGRRTAEVLIIDDDTGDSSVSSSSEETIPTVNLVVGPASITESWGSNGIHIMAELSSTTNRVVRVVPTFSAGDYVLGPRVAVIEIRPGNREAFIGIFFTVNHDLVEEDDEVITVGFGSIINAKPGSGGTLTIIDDDGVADGVTAEQQLRSEGSRAAAAVYTTQQADMMRRLIFGRSDHTVAPTEFGGFIGVSLPDHEPADVLGMISGTALQWSSTESDGEGHGDGLNVWFRGAQSTDGAGGLATSLSSPNGLSYGFGMGSEYRGLANGQATVGLSMSYLRSDLNYSSQGSASSASSGSYRNDTYMLSAYGEFDVAEGTNMWVILGGGTGTLKDNRVIRSASSGAITTTQGQADTLSWVFDAGARHGMLFPITDVGVLEFDVTSSAQGAYSIIDTMRYSGSGADAITVPRSTFKSLELRSGMQIGLPLEGENYSITPFAGLDAVSNSGSYYDRRALEASVGARGDSGRFDLTLKANVDIAYEDERSWGISGGVSYNYLPDGSGLSISLGGRHDTNYNVPGSSFLSQQDGGWSTSSEIGYGFLTSSWISQGRLTPYLSGSVGERENTYAGGLRFESVSYPLEVELGGRRLLPESGLSEDKLELALRLRF